MWIEIKLPYSMLPQDQETLLPPEPNLEQEELSLFGITSDQCFELCNEELWSKIWLQVHVEFAGKKRKLTEEKLLAAVNTETQRRFKQQDPEAAKYDKLYRKIRDWKTAHPETIAWSSAYDKVREQDKARTFAGRGLAQPGVQIEVEINGETKRFLIGHINQLRGVCDDCTEFDSTTIVQRYRVLIPAEELDLLDGQR
jgi:hypothetical protein